VFNKSSVNNQYQGQLRPFYSAGLLHAFVTEKVVNMLLAHQKGSVIFSPAHMKKIDLSGPQ